MKTNQATPINHLGGSGSDCDCGKSVGQSPGRVTAACTVELSDGSFEHDVKRFDHGTHNTAEWLALILGLRLALKHGERRVVVRGDSMLVVVQISHEWRTKNAALSALRTQ